MNESMKAFVPIIMAVMLVAVIMRGVWWFVQSSESTPKAGYGQQTYSEVMKEVIKLGGAK